METAERYLGSRQRIAHAVNDKLGIEPDAKPAEELTANATSRADPEVFPKGGIDHLPKAKIPLRSSTDAALTLPVERDNHLRFLPYRELYS